MEYSEGLGCIYTLSGRLAALPLSQRLAEAGRLQRGGGRQKSFTITVYGSSAFAESFGVLSIPRGPEVLPFQDIQHLVWRTPSLTVLYELAVKLRDRYCTLNLARRFVHSLVPVDRKDRFSGKVSIDYALVHIVIYMSVVFTVLDLRYLSNYRSN
jgi:hypothetical protein